MIIDRVLERPGDTPWLRALELLAELGYDFAVIGEPTTGLDPAQVHAAWNARNADHRGPGSAHLDVLARAAGPENA